MHEKVFKQAIQLCACFGLSAGKKYVVHPVVAWQEPLTGQ